MDEAAVCIVNIGPRERRKRATIGVAALGVSLALAAVLIWTGAARAWRLTLFVPLYVAGLGLFQARDKT